jgi:hypothetical protein
MVANRTIADFMPASVLQGVHLGKRRCAVAVARIGQQTKTPPLAIMKAKVGRHWDCLGNKLPTARAGREKHAMTSEQIKIVQLSFREVVPIKDKTAALFYDCMISCAAV